MTHWNEIEEKHNTLVLLLRNKDILTYLESENLLTDKYKEEQLKIIRSGEKNEQARRKNL